jgi:hypothetical protein
MTCKKTTLFLYLLSCSLLVATTPDNFSSTQRPSSLDKSIHSTQLVSLTSSLDEGQKTPPQRLAFKGNLYQKVQVGV